MTGKGNDPYDAAGDGFDDGSDLDPEQLDALMNEVLGTSIPRPVRWADLQPAEYADQLRILAGWVQWLGRRYDLDAKELPADWWQHGAHVEELSALKGAWDVANDPTQAASAAADWHLTFYNTRIRLREWTSRLGGKPGERPDPQTQRWLADPAGSGWAGEFSTYLRNLTAGGDDPPAG